MKKLLLIAVFLVPLMSYGASTHHYTCADTWDYNPTGVPCSSDVYTYSAPNDITVDGGNTYPLTNGTTYYLSFRVVGTGHINVGLNDNSNSCTASYTTGTYTDIPCTSNYDSPSAGNSTWIDDRTSQSMNPNFSGTISNLCITDTPGACASGGGGGGGGGGGNTSVATSTPALLTADALNLYRIAILLSLVALLLVRATKRFWFF